MMKDLPSSLKKNWKQLLDEGQRLSFRKGQVLVYEGHLPYGIFVLQSGKVSFSREGVLCQEGHLLKSMNDTVIGLDCFLEGEPCCCTCTAEEDCRVVFISKTQLLPSLKPGPKKARLHSSKKLEIRSN